MKPNSKDQREKRLRGVVREIKRLRDILVDPPSIRLEEPIQKGWVRRYVLTQEAERRPDRETLGEILRDIGPEKHSHRPDFLKKKRRGSRKLVEIDQPLHAIIIDRWSTKRYPRCDTWKRYFHFEYRPYHRGLQWFYVFTETHLFELKIEPFWLTHVKVIDGPAIERQAELEAWMEHRWAWRKYERLKGIRQCSGNEDLSRKLERQAKRESYRFQFNPEEAEMRPSRWRFRFSFFLILPT